MSMRREIARAGRISAMASRPGTSPSCSPRRGPGARASTSASIPTGWWSSRTDSSSSCPCQPFFINGLLQFLFNALQAFVTAQNLGEVLFVGVRVRLWAGKYREPDVVVHACGTCRPNHRRLLGGRRPGDGGGQRRRRRPPPRSEDETRGICPGRHPRVLDRRPGTGSDHRLDARRTELTPSTASSNEASKRPRSCCLVSPSM